MISRPFVRVFLVHIGFHTFWVLVYVLSLSGLFILIPLVGSYNAFVLGFLGNSVLGSATQAAFLGYLVFAATGLLSGWLISLLRPKSGWILGWLSLAVTGMLLTMTSSIRHRSVGVSGTQSTLTLPTTTGRADMTELRLALKLKYHLVEPAVPPHLMGKETVVLFSELQPLLQGLPKDFQLSGGPYVYCNLPPQVWDALKKDQAGGKYPLLWSTQPDGTGKRLVVSVDLKNEQFSDEILESETVARMISELELAVRSQTGDHTFTFRK